MIRTFLTQVAAGDPSQAAATAAAHKAAAIAGTAASVAIVSDGVIALLLCLLICILWDRGWSIGEAMCEATTATISTGDNPRVLIRLTPSSSRLTAMVGTILFTVLTTHCIGVTLAALTTGQTIDLSGASTLFYVAAGFFAPYSVNKVASAVAGTSKPAVASDWKLGEAPPAGKFEMERTSLGTVMDRS